MDSSENSWLPARRAKRHARRKVAFILAQPGESSYAPPLRLGFLVRTIAPGAMHDRGSHVGGRSAAPLAATPGCREPGADAQPVPEEVAPSHAAWPASSSSSDGPRPPPDSG